MLALLFRLRILKPALLRFRDGTLFKVRTAMDVWVIIETYLGHTYEQNSFDIQRNWVMIDIGAGIGEFSITAAKKSPHGIVYAFEPFEESFDLMQENILLNNITNVRAYPYAVGGKAGLMNLNTDSGVPVLYSTTNNHLGSRNIIVQGTTVDEIFGNFRIERCDLIKIDCEGAEYDILFHTVRLHTRKSKEYALNIIME